MESAADGKGRLLVFNNAALSGGICWRYADDETSGEEDCGLVGCYIARRQVLVMGAYFGGIVAQPLNREQLATALSRRGTDLT
ncbi:MAG: hypothetical protein ACI9KE_005056 [Polyangiales bacterium]